MLIIYFLQGCRKPYTNQRANYSWFNQKLITDQTLWLVRYFIEDNIPPPKKNHVSKPNIITKHCRTVYVSVVCLLTPYYRAIHYWCSHMLYTDQTMFCELLYKRRKNHVSKLNTITRNIVQVRCSKSMEVLYVYWPPLQGYLLLM